MSKLTEPKKFLRWSRIIKVAKREESKELVKAYAHKARNDHRPLLGNIELKKIKVILTAAVVASSEDTAARFMAQINEDRREHKEATNQLTLQ